MYLEAKSCVKSDGSVSSFFEILTGVRQGKNLSPTLFAMFLNDFKNFLAQSCKGLEYLGNYMQDLGVFARLYVLLYADDTVLLAESTNELQTSLTSLKNYCDMWGLKVNRDKTQIVIFSKGRITKRPDFYLGEEIIEVVDDYTYLGVILNYNGNYLKAISNQKKTANKAMNALLAKTRLLELDIDTTLELFQRCVVPILIYGCEVWGYQSNNIKVLEVFYRKFIKTVLKLSNATPTCMVYGESGQPCITYLINTRVINFWAKLKFDDTPRLSKNLFKTISTCHGSRMLPQSGASLPAEPSLFNFSWFAHVKCLLSELELDYMWYTDCSANYSSIVSQIKKHSKALFYEKWLNTVANNSQCDVYRLHKRAWGLSDYLTQLDAKKRVPITKFLTRNHYLPVNANKFKKADEPAKSTVCALCTRGETGDELHYLFRCSAFDGIRKYHPILLNSNLLTVDEAKGKFGEVFTCTDSKVLSNLSIFIDEIMDTFTPEVEDEPLTELPIRKSHVTRAGRASVRPKHLNDFFV